MSSQLHRSDPRILGRRTLAEHHRHLAALLRPGLSVLDVGCGTGSITAGIARAVGAAGSVVGIDRDEHLLGLAREEHGSLENLQFEPGDALQLEASEQFDIVTAARTLQWVGDPAGAVARMKRAVKPGGLVVVLDFDHEENRWEPVPPAEFLAFYQAFLAWREGNGWDNRMASHLPALFRDAGLVEVASLPSDETARRGEAGFAGAAPLWADTIDSAGSQLPVDGLPRGLQVAEVSRIYRAWIEKDLQVQTLSMRTVVGRVPDRS